MPYATGQEVSAEELTKLVAGPKKDADSDSHDYTGFKAIRAKLTAATIGKFIFAIQNPEAVECVIYDVVLHVTTGATDTTCAVDVDIGGSSTGTGDSIMDGMTEMDAAGVYDRHTQAGSNGGNAVKWDENGGSNDWVTGKVATADATALVGEVVVLYMPTGGPIVT